MLLVLIFLLRAFSSLVYRICFPLQDLKQDFLWHHLSTFEYWLRHTFYDINVMPSTMAPFHWLVNVQHTRHYMSMVLIFFEIAIATPTVLGQFLKCCKVSGQLTFIKTKYKVFGQLTWIWTMYKVLWQLNYIRTMHNFCDNWHVQGFLTCNITIMYNVLWQLTSIKTMYKFYDNCHGVGQYIKFYDNWHV